MYNCYSILLFKPVRELIEVAQVLEACIGESQQGHRGTGKKKMGIIPIVDHHF
jgi:hypothetical protein